MKQKHIGFLLIAIVLLIFLISYLSQSPQNPAQPSVQSPVIPHQTNPITTTALITQNNATDNATDNEKLVSKTPLSNESANIDEFDIIQCDPALLLNTESIKEIQDLLSQQVAQFDMSQPNEQLISILTSNKAQAFDLNGEKKSQTKYTKEHLEYTNALLNFHQQYPNNVLAYSQLLSSCMKSSYPFCTDTFFEKITEYEENGELWLKIASIYSQQEQFDKANNALKRASETNNFTSYFYEKIELIYRTFLKYNSTETNNPDIVPLAHQSIGLTPLYLGPVNYCRSAEVNSVLAETCFELGQQMKDNSQSMLGTIVGIGLMKTYYEKHNFKELALEVIKEKPFNKESMSRFNQASNVMFFDPSLFIQWLDSGLNYGEAKANQQLIDEVIWRSKDPNYQPCPNIQNQ